MTTLRDALRKPDLLSSALIFYEYSITFSDETRLFWTKKITGAVVLFFANRYITLAYNLYLIYFENAPQSGGEEVSFLAFLQVAFTDYSFQL